MRNRVGSAGGGAPDAGLAAGGVISTEEHRRQDPLRTWRRRRYMETMRTIALLALSASLAQAAVLPRLRVSENGRFFILVLDDASRNFPAPGKGVVAR